MCRPRLPSRAISLFSYEVISVFIGSSSQISCGDLSSGPNRPTYVQSLKKFIESWLYIYGIL